MRILLPIYSQGRGGVGGSLLHVSMFLLLFFVLSKRSTTFDRLVSIVGRNFSGVAVGFVLGSWRLLSSEFS